MGSSLSSEMCARDRKLDREHPPVPPVTTELFDEHQKLLTAAGWQGFVEWSGSVQATDTLLIIDMQNDFLPESVAPQGGRFGVAEGGATVEPIIKLIEAFSDVGALIVATRDYHPFDHCSFSGCGGPFPPHCVQGSKGSFFFPPIGDALKEAISKDSSGKQPPAPKSLKRRGSAFGKDAVPTEWARPTGNVLIAFKGFVEEVESFGGFEYAKEHYETRVCSAVTTCRWEVDQKSSITEGLSCSGPWTGAIQLKCSCLLEDINAPPDVTAILRKDRKVLHEAIPKDGRLLVVGLAFDFCVTDSAINAAKLGYSSVFIAGDAARAAHIPNHGKFGSGFLTDPKFLVEKWKELGIGLVRSEDVMKA
eukprot:CAMPEP_0197629858 /NCGR_PEP_ID=MMETSP1338-20131121/7546_1 /TAXON_ID=43686 ORGANISM="Pelagodinium beii, Strain RCC1491" /NCGR_SAMPLE_ID=MMETSP1338 /ASSEMBLY_ACC=CAM_ASM_000754 /LENGTH=362 /DNA_ID=CAMNT_0043200965 /DNA_START=42 /DNA_END=1130 /DNA_ORIENTATION=-